MKAEVFVSMFVSYSKTLFRVFLLNSFLFTEQEEC